jgi:hypothetical protein
VLKEKLGIEINVHDTPQQGGRRRTAARAKGEKAREEMALVCRTPLQVQRIAWEALKPGFEEGEQPMSRETILNVIAPDVRDIRTELKRLGYTARDIAYDYGYNASQVNRFLDGKLPADDPAARQMAVFLKAVGLGL